MRRFSLPSRPQSTATESGIPDSAGAESSEVAPARPLILLVEDNQADACLVREALEEHSVCCELIVMSDGQAAIDFINYIERNSGHPCPDLVILDLNLPRKPGTEVLRHIRSGARCHTVPIVILTSSDNQTDKDKAATMGAHRYLCKPSNLNAFLALGQIFKEQLNPVQ